MSEYLAAIEHEGNSWGAFCPDLPGVGVVGESRDEVERLVDEAIELHVRGLRDSGQPVPEPTAVASTLIAVGAAR